ncbi:MAG TPA: carbohydrate-binding family 9-like protein [Bryobacteraceae bacterium]|nr:carbohydrate-binding family 9-like protein [Bryobacteraceae bacterium]
MTRLIAALIAVAGVGFADGSGVIRSYRARSDFALTADPNAPQWKNAQGVIAENDSLGKPVRGHRTEIRSRWTNENLYFLFVCPYEELNLKSDPSATTETSRLWEWDVAEVFIGWDADNIHQYKEFQVSPQSEWVDLDIDAKNRRPDAWMWNSGFRVKGRVEEARKVWYGEMQIPWKTIDPRPVKAGNELRLNLYRWQGPKAKRVGIAWQPTGAANYHVPESFGRIVLVDK